jgi:putative methyl-accepting chemotaxis sensory transducer with pas/pac sensor
MLDFEHVIAQINRMGNDIFILVDKRFETDCFYDKIGVIKDFVVVNSAPDYDVLSILATLDFGAQSFIKKDGHYFYVRAFSDENGTKLGYIILHREG